MPQCEIDQELLNALFEARYNALRLGFPDEHDALTSNSEYWDALTTLNAWRHFGIDTRKRHDNKE